MKTKKPSWQTFLLHPVDASSIATFRILFGLIMAYYVIVFRSPDIINYQYIQPDFFFSFKLFHILRLQPLPDAGMYILFLLMLIAAVGIAFGFFYRCSLALFFITFGYTFLLEKSYYNNHYVLIIALTFLLFFMDAHRWASLDTIRKPHLNTQQIPFWNLFMLRAQICILYFFSGITKLDKDWLNGQYFRTLSKEWGDYFILGNFIQADWMHLLFSYGGLIFDLTIGFFLCYRRTRIIAILFTISFHLMNRWLFNIGIFPHLMLATIVLFVEPETPRHIYNKFTAYFGFSQSNQPNLNDNAPHSSIESKLRTNFILGFIIIYLFIQLFLPLRHLLIPGYVNWTLQGEQFSWRLMRGHRWGTITIYATDQNQQFQWELFIDNWGLNLEKKFNDPTLASAFASNPFFEQSVYNLTESQGVEIMNHPSMTLHYVHLLRDELKKIGINKPIITVNARISINGRPLYPIIDGTVNLAEVEYHNFAHNDWIILLPKEDKIKQPHTTK